MASRRNTREFRTPLAPICLPIVAYNDVRHVQSVPAHKVVYSWNFTANPLRQQ